jgi:hypothetical protein
MASFNISFIPSRLSFSFVCPSLMFPAGLFLWRVRVIYVYIYIYFFFFFAWGGYQPTRTTPNLEGQTLASLADIHGSCWTFTATVAISGHISPHHASPQQAVYYFPLLTIRFVSAINEYQNQVGTQNRKYYICKMCAVYVFPTLCVVSGWNDMEYRHLPEGVQ